MVLAIQNIQCFERLHFSLAATFCNYRKEWNKEETYDVTTSFTITYIKGADAYGGKFWLQAEGNVKWIDSTI